MFKYLNILVMKKIIIGIACIILWSSLSVSAQNISTYSGPMKMAEDIIGLSKSNPYEGDGQYDYYVGADGNRVKHGKYYFINSVERGVQNGDKMAMAISMGMYLSCLSVQGQFVNGKKEGTWIINYFSETYTINFKNDLYDGALTVKSRLDPSRIMKCQFKDNHFIGNLMAKGSEGWILKGQFDEDGLVDGTWTLECNLFLPKSYSYRFTHGIFIGSYEYDDSTGDTNDLKVGSGHEVGLIGPPVLRDFDNCFYISDYLKNRVFASTAKPFLYQDKNSNKIERSRIHNSYNIIEFEQQKIKEETEKAERLERERIKEEERRKEQAKKQEEIDKFKAEHPHVYYDGDIAADIVQLVQPKLPKVRGIEALMIDPYFVKVWVKVSGSGGITDIGGLSIGGDKNERRNNFRTVVKEAIQSLYKNDKWVGGYAGLEYTLWFDYTPRGKVKVKVLSTKIIE